MRALVVFESMYGNTEAVAEAVVQGLSTRLEVDVMDVTAAPAAVGDGVALVVVGAPTHAFGLSRSSTRVDAAQRGEARAGSTQRGVREWLADVRPTGIAAATFDTRVSKPRMPGSAARAAGRRMRRLGFHMAAPAKSFYVVGGTGPLVDGELDRARQWGEQLAAAVAAEPGPVDPRQH